MGKPIHLDSAMINNTRPSCVKVKVQEDLATKLPEYVKLEVQSSKTNEATIQKVKMQYDILPKYCHTCKLQGHMKMSVEACIRN